MSMSTHLTGIKPPDDVWLRMKAVYDACEVANVTPPSQVLAFFDGEPPDERGVTRYLAGMASGSKSEAVRIYKEDGREGFEVELDKLPRDIKVLRFVNSW